VVVGGCWRAGIRGLGCAVTGGRWCFREGDFEGWIGLASSFLNVTAIAAD
jgi:hypothetical protein